MRLVDLILLDHFYVLAIDFLLGRLDDHRYNSLLREAID